MEGACEKVRHGWYLVFGAKPEQRVVGVHVSDRVVDGARGKTGRLYFEVHVFRLFLV